MPILDLNSCPCSGKNISTLVAPWILLTLYENDGLHGYDIQKIIVAKLQVLGFGLNPGGLYRHLKLMEKRGVLSSTWDTSGSGPARHNFSLTEAGKECLWRWIGTLSTHATLVGKFMEEAQKVFPNAVLPKVSLASVQTEGTEELLWENPERLP